MGPRGPALPKEASTSGPVTIPYWTYSAQRDSEPTANSFSGSEGVSPALATAKTILAVGIRFVLTV